MKPLLAFVFLTLAQQVGGSVVIDHSFSLDRRFHFVALGKAEPGYYGDRIYYRVETKDGESASRDMPSDFGVLRPITSVVRVTPIRWRPDGKYVVLATDHDRHHGDFIILKHDNDRFVEIPFDWGKTWNAAMPSDVGFGYPEFVSWSPRDRIKIRIERWNAGNDTGEAADFIVNLSDTSHAVSSKKVH
jgi:hypothetical protein